MIDPLQLLRAFVGQTGLAVMLTVFLAGLFVYVMTRNYRRMIREDFQPHLLDGEIPLDRVDVTGLLSSTRTLLTNRRALQLRLAWFFSRRKLFSVSLTDVHSVAFRRSLPWLVLILAVLVSGRLNPVAFLLFLWALCSKLYTVLLDTPFAQMPWTRLWVSTRDRGLFPILVRFYNRSHEAWARTRAINPSNTPGKHKDDVAEQEADFGLNRTIWAGVLALMGTALTQRALGGHVSLDSLPFGPVYLAIPVAVARFSRRDGFWVALLGFVGLITVKFPTTGLIGLLASDGGIPDPIQYLGILVTLLLMTETSSFLARSGRPAISAVAVLLWVAFIALLYPSVLGDLSLYAQVFFAAALSVAIAAVMKNTTSRVGFPEQHLVS